MKTEIIQQLQRQFDALSQLVPDENVEFWFARDLMAPLGYARWENFQAAIKRAIETCETTDFNPDNHFRGVTKMVKLGSGAERSVEDYMLTRYACYLIVQNGDPRKEPIAFAQRYFAIQTRKQELIEDRMRLQVRLDTREKLRETSPCTSNLESRTSNLESRISNLESQEFKTLNLKPPTINLVCQIAKEAGQAILSIYDGDHEVELKADNSPLTAADKASHQVIVAGLQQHFPAIPILSEEGAAIPYAERKDWARFWCVDPLDGTKEFIKRNGEFTVNIALIEEGRPVAGVVYVPVQDKLYFGVVEEGAWCEEKVPAAKNEVEGSGGKAQGSRCQDSDFNLAPETLNLRPIHVRQPDHEAGLTVVMSRSHSSPELEEYLKGIKVAEALPVGSSLKLCVVAEGLADIYPRLGPTMEWDTAAGHAVVVAAGGTVNTPEGFPLVYNKENLLNPYFIVENAG